MKMKLDKKVVDLTKRLRYLQAEAVKQANKAAGVDSIEHDRQLTLINAYGISLYNLAKVYGKHYLSHEVA